MENNDLPTPKQVKAARALLAWTQADLAREAKVAVSTVADFERGQRNPVPNNSQAMRDALVAKGIQFGGGAIAFRHEYMDTATGETERTPKTTQKSTTAEHIAGVVRADLNSPRPDAQDIVRPLLIVLDRYAQKHDGLCAICGEYHDRHLSTCWRPLVG